MLKELDFPKLTPAVWAIMNAQDVDISVAYSMAKQNLREGRTVHGGMALPEEFRPDWHALGAQYNAHEHDGDISSDTNRWVRTMKSLAFDLAPLWRAGDYEGMAALVANTADPGPAGQGPARQEWEEAQEAETPDHE